MKSQSPHGNKIIIIYKSSTGFTKKYAEMIAEEIECDLADYKSATAKMLSQYDTVVFGSRAHAGMIDGYKQVKELLQNSATDRFILFVTGAAPNSETDIITKFWEQNLTADELTKIPHFWMQSGLCYEKMSFSDKLMMKVFSFMLKHKKEKEPYEKNFEQAISSSYDISSKAYAEPLISFLRT